MAELEEGAGVVSYKTLPPSVLRAVGNFQTSR